MNIRETGGLDQRDVCSRVNRAGHTFGLLGDIGAQRIVEVALSQDVAD